MSSEDTRRTLELLFNKLGGGAPIEEIESLFAEDVDWRIAGDETTVPWVGARSNPAEVGAFYTQLASLTEPVKFEVHALLVDGSSAVALGIFESRVRSTGKLIASEFALHVKVMDGRIVRYRFFEDSFAVSRAVT